jgi:D-glucosaminate-6-phosphate ammonia-lyase
MLDLDVFPDLWQVPDEFAPLRRLPGLPHHGVGRSCKVGKEEVVGLLLALERFVADKEDLRRAAWRATLEEIVAAAGRVPGMKLHILDHPVPLLEVKVEDADGLAARLALGTPSIRCSLARRHEGVVLFSPVSLAPEHARVIGKRLRAG